MVVSDNTPLSELGLSVRALNTAESVGATTVGQLQALTEDQVVARKGFAATALAELRAKLFELGLRFRDRSAG